jgi:hypothetical protein
MLISYGRPAYVAGSWGLTGTGAAFVSSAAKLTTLRPAEACRMQWLSGSPTLAQTMVLTGTNPGSSPANRITARVAGILFPQNSTVAKLPAGVNIQFAGKLSAGAVALGGNALTSTTQVLPGGAVAAWCVFPPAIIDQIVVTIPNNASGSTWATAQMQFDIGEIWIGKGADFAARNDLEEDLQGGLTQRKSHNNQAWPLMIVPFKVYTVNLVPMSEQVAIGPNPYQDDLETVGYQLATSPGAVVIPKYMQRGFGPLYNGQPPAVITPATIDAQRLIRSAKLGVLDSDFKMTGNGDINIVSQIVFGETPP